MGFFSKITKPFKKAAEVVTKPFAKITNKILPNELRFLAPYAAGIGSLMLGPTMSPFMRALASGGLNIAGQIAADERNSHIAEYGRHVATSNLGAGHSGAAHGEGREQRAVDFSSDALVLPGPVRVTL